MLAAVEKYYGSGSPVNTECRRDEAPDVSLSHTDVGVEWSPKRLFITLLNILYFSEISYECAKLCCSK